MKFAVCAGILISSIVVVAGQSYEECKGEDQFWNNEENVCKICTRCPKGWHTTVDECGFGVGSQGKCMECATGFYQDNNHTKKQCKQCTRCDSVNGVREIRQCTSTQNRLCECIPGFVKHSDLDNLCVPCNEWECLNAATTKVQPTSRQISSQRIAISATSPLRITTSQNLRTSSFSTWTDIESTPAESTPSTITTHIPSMSSDDLIKVSLNKTGNLKVILIIVGVLSVLVTALVVLIWKWKGREYLNRLRFDALEQSDPEIGANGRHACQRSISAPAGLQSSLAQGTSASCSPKLPTLGTDTRDKVIKMGKKSKEREVRSRAEKAKARGNSMYIDTLNYDVLQELHQKLTPKENNSKINMIKDWRHLASKWHYTKKTIGYISSANDGGIMTLFDTEMTEHPDTRTLESLINDLQGIKRQDAANIVIEYILNDKITAV
ncbi:uncharacterized protein [Amphiura filiformis]|uniref:uncharacterized protein n=1 Tax=Amphiura filiformis TaxID=82378 RepID=UPI003B22144B